MQLRPGFATDTLKPARTEVAPAKHPAGISHIKPCFYCYDNEHRLHIVQYLFAQWLVFKIKFWCWESVALLKGVSNHSSSQFNCCFKSCNLPVGSLRKAFALPVLTVWFNQVLCHVLFTLAQYEPVQPRQSKKVKANVHIESKGMQWNATQWSGT